MKSNKSILLLLAVLAVMAGSFLTGRWNANFPVPVVKEPADRNTNRNGIVETPEKPDFPETADRVEPEKTIDVILAKKDLPAGAILEEKQLENLLYLSKFKKSTVPPDMIVNADEIKGKRLNRDIKRGSFFLATDFVNDAGIRLPEGKSKYSIKIARGNGHFAQPADKVDVILTATDSSGVAKSEVILRNVLVLAVDRIGGKEVNAVTLAVTLRDALALATAERRGEIRLLIRDPNAVDDTP